MSSLADPRILLRYELGPAIIDAEKAITHAHRSVREAQARARGSKRLYTNSFAILAATRAVELYRGSKDRKEEIKINRQSQRTSSRRMDAPLTRAPRRADEWEGSPTIPAGIAAELSPKHANEWLSLMWLGFFQTESSLPFDRKALQLLEGALPQLYRKPRTVSNICGALRITMARRMKRQPSKEMYHFHEIVPAGTTSINQLAIKVFDHWKHGVLSEQIRSGRLKFRPIRV